jgi:hypothetical protein
MFGTSFGIPEAIFWPMEEMGFGCLVAIVVATGATMILFGCHRSCSNLSPSHKW